MLRICFSFVGITLFFYSIGSGNTQNLVKPSLQTAIRNTSTGLICPDSTPEQRNKNIIWYFSLMDEEGTKPVSNSPRFLLDEDGKSLTIRNVSTEDAGMFSCCYAGPCYDTYFVVLDFENILSFTSDVVNKSATMIISSKGDFAIAAYHGSPINVEFKKQRHVSHISHHNDNMHHITRRRKTSTQYYVENATLQTSGQIAIYLSFGDLKEYFLLNVLIHGQAILKMECLRSAEKISINCHGEAYPPPLFGFDFIPADMRHSDAEHEILVQSITHSSLTTNVSASAVMKLPLSESGFIECRASNSEGTSYASLFLPKYSNNFDSLSNERLSAEPQQLQFKITSSKETISVGSVVHVQCEGNVYEISNSFVFQYNNIEYYVDGTEHGDNWEANFSFNATSYEEVVCIATLKNGAQLRTNLILQLESEDFKQQALKYWYVFIIALGLLILAAVIIWRFIANRYFKLKGLAPNYKKNPRQMLMKRNRIIK